MAVDYQRILSKLATRRLLVGFIVLGALLVLVKPVSEKYVPHLLGDFVLEIGKAFVIAGILGWAVDEALKNDLVRNAVSAALGYLLPDRLKTELRWLYDQKILVQEVYAVRLEHFPDERAVRLSGTYNRRFENIAGERTVVTLAGGTDEWFHQKGESTIEACEYRRIRSDKPEQTVIVPVKKAALGIGYNVGDVALDVEEVIELVMSYTMWLPDHGYEFLTHKYMVDRPLVNLELPPTLVGFVAFSHRDNYSEDDFKTGHISVRLERVLLPHQDIRICWHRRDNVQQRMQAITAASAAN